MSHSYDLLMISGQSLTTMTYMYENNWVAENEDQMRKRIRSCLRKVDKKSSTIKWENVYRKVGAVHRDG